MRIDCALLCDAATVREGLLHVLGGGVTRVNRPGFPAPIAPLTLAVRILVHPTETDRAHHLDIRLQDADGGELAKIEVQFGVNDPGNVDPGEEVSVPMPLIMPEPLILPHAGRYSFELLIDGSHQLAVPFTATQVEAEGGA
ncbi:MAG: hypothetical protein WKF94_00785 [Solirubrobacteraceae bacterium]